METRIKERFNDMILQEAMQRYDITDDQIQLLDGFESFMYEFEREQEEYILRIGHSFRRTEALIQGEVDWINYLAAGGASVAKAILSENGKLVEAIDDTRGGYFLATAFVKAQGKLAWEIGWTPELYETYGRLLGRIHALTKKYELADMTWKRPQWDDPISLDVERHVPVSEASIIKKYQGALEHLRSLPRDNDSYGLIHQDAHPGNFFVDEAGNITLFDFDDCVYSWFIYDIAMPLFYMVLDRKDEPEFTREFMRHFLQGYARENGLEATWLKELPYFLKFREIDLYALVHRSFDVDNLDDPWCINYMKNRKGRIENDVPYIDFDFESLEPHLSSDCALNV